MRYILLLVCVVLCKTLCDGYATQEDLDEALEEFKLVKQKLEQKPAKPEDLELLVELLRNDYDKLAGLRDLFQAVPDHPVFGGQTDPDFSKPIFAGQEDPDHSPLIFGGESDPDHFRLIPGGAGDPDHSRIIPDGAGDPDQFRPMFGVEGDPDHSRLILGGEEDPDHDGYLLGGQNDPEEDAKITPESEFDENADYPGKFGYRRPVPRNGNIKPILGRDPAKVSKPKEDIPAAVDPCLPSPFPEPRPFKKLCSNPSDGSEGETNADLAECPEYEVQEISNEMCGFQIRRYHKGVWVLTAVNTKKEFGDAYKEALGKLAGYMSGENVDEVDMGETKPVTLTYIMKDKKTPKAAYLSMFLPVAYHTDPPKPLEDSSMWLKHNEELTFYVRSFGGTQPTFHDYQREFAMLGAAIKKVDLNAVWYMPFVHEYSEPSDDELRHEVAYLLAPLTSP